MSRELFLKIADFQIHLLSDTELILEEGYAPFVVSQPNEHPELKVVCKTGLPSIDLSDSKPLFEAENEIQKFYSIYQYSDGYIFVNYNQEQINTIQQIAYLNIEMTEWQVFSTSECSNFPLKYPFGPLMMHYLTVKYHAVMIHASCVSNGNKGRIFTGFSGNGKSTMAGIWAKNGYTIVNDDRIIIRRTEKGYVAHNTPMYYSDLPKETHLDGLFLISHSPINQINIIEGAVAISRVLAFCIQNNYDKQLINNHLTFIADMCAQVPVYDLGFVPNSAVVNFVLENEA